MAVFNPAIKKTFIVKAAGGKFLIDDVVAPILSIQRDHLYVFNQNDSSNAGSDAAGSHQLYFSKTQDGKHTIDIGVEYGKEFRHGVSYWLDGVRQFNLAAYVAGFHLASTREVRIVVPDDAPYKLYPVCWNHSNMYNTNYFHIGSASSNTGFFSHFREGAIDEGVFNITTPSTNQVVAIDATNVNNTDVWLYKLDSFGAEQELWTKVDSVEGNNVVYNSLAKSVNNIYAVLTRVDDRISLMFSDGVFGNLPKGSFRVFYRVSKNERVIIKRRYCKSISNS